MSLMAVSTRLSSELSPFLLPTSRCGPSRPQAGVYSWVRPGPTPVPQMGSFPNLQFEELPLSLQRRHCLNSLALVPHTLASALPVCLSSACALLDQNGLNSLALLPLTLASALPVCLSSTCVRLSLNGNADDQHYDLFQGKVCIYV